ncbi:hypothetical protein [Clostridium magnum]|uniref:Uncharacterized protein n=1 Tax=Clostridium magnum DSM 2767 TaxID=1121326 RepID=A0A162RQA3_9CLOT|nr:hypothetical protein [Clostridium magnum]KZL90233.1 hypothetical protein CLMAG_40040 [Clostridium magnum DSM 2767]SHI13998.1 hypothetical protein SAMN02745944_02688 [Clostridium magnum DSM 2767]
MYNSDLSRQFTNYANDEDLTIAIPDNYNAILRAVNVYGYYYVYKMARKTDEDNVVIIPYSTGNPLGKAYGVDNNLDARIVFRVYLDKIAMVGPYIYDAMFKYCIIKLFRNLLHLEI